MSEEEVSEEELQLINEALLVCFGQEGRDRFIKYLSERMDEL